MNLRTKYQLYYSSGIENRKNMTKEDFENQLKPLTSFETAEQFWDIFLHLKLPSKLHLKSKLFIFKGDVQPVWEHPENKNGGRLYFKLPMNKESEEMWQNLSLELLTGFGGHESLDKIVNGIEMSIRQVDQLFLAVWINQSDSSVIRELFHHLKANVPFYDNLEFDFSQHPRKFIEHAQ